MSSVLVRIKSENADLVAMAPTTSYPAWTNLVDPSKLSLNAQNNRVKQVVKNSLIFLWAFFSWTDAYPDVKILVEFVRKSLLKAAKHLKDDDMVRRLSIDITYNQALSPLVCINSTASHDEHL